MTAETMALALGLTLEQFRKLEHTDVEFFSKLREVGVHQLQDYAAELGYGRWFVRHKHGQLRAVIAHSAKMACREAGWPMNECTLEEVVSR